ncbi:unnamed protein product [Urochloa humidicola]
MPPSTKPPATSVMPAGAVLPAPRSESKETRKTLLMDIESYSDAKKLPNGRYIRSRKFNAGGHSWYMFFYPNGFDLTTAGTTSLYLQLAADDGNGVAVQAQYQFMVVDQGGEVRFKSTCISSTFDKVTHMRGFRCFVTHEDLERLCSIKECPFKIRCDITILEKRRELPAKVKASVSGLHADIARLLVAKEGKDVDSEVGGKVFAAHRCVLAARSSVFKADLFGPGMEKDTSYIRVDGIIPEAFDALLHFIYTDSLPEMNMHDVELIAQHLLVAAERYDLKEMKSIIENRLCCQVGVTTALRSLVFAEQHKCSKLKKRCLEFIAAGENARKIMENDGAEHLVTSCPSVVRDLIIEILSTPRRQLSFPKIIFGHIA